MKTVNLYFRLPPKGYKIFPGDRYLLDVLRKISGKRKIGGVERVFINLCRSFDELNVKYTVNKPFNNIKPDEPVVVLGVGRYSLQGYALPNPIIAGIGLMTHPSEWPDLFKEYPVSKYLQHSLWAKNVYAPYYGEENCDVWPAGIDTKKWQPANAKKNFDILIYDKIRWDNEGYTSLKHDILKKLDKAGLSYREIKYGNYSEKDYQSLLQQCHAMIFLCEHESQGLACCEAMAMNVPVLAWDQGYCLDPNRFSWGETDMPASSVPFFDENCGARFKDLKEFETQLPLFWQNVKTDGLAPRAFIEANLSLKKSGERMLEIIKSVYS